jgi:hypothetical protein
MGGWVRRGGAPGLRVRYPGLSWERAGAALGPSFARALLVCVPPHIRASPSMDAGQCVTPRTMLGKRRHGDGTPDAAVHAMTSPAVVRRERLPAKTPLYCVLPRTLDQVDVAALAALSPPPETLFTLSSPTGLGAAARVCEYLLLQPAVLVCTAEPPSEAVLRQLGCDGWCDEAGGRVLLLTPGLLQLVDDDKQAGLAQAFLTDMFFRNSMRTQPMRP